jgi:hypothetical protein
VVEHVLLGARAADAALGVLLRDEPLEAAADDLRVRLAGRVNDARVDEREEGKGGDARVVRVDECAPRAVGTLVPREPVEGRDGGGVDAARAGWSAARESFDADGEARDRIGRELDGLRVVASAIVVARRSLAELEERPRIRVPPRFDDGARKRRRGRIFLRPTRRDGYARDERDAVHRPNTGRERSVSALIAVA